jgi:hypothetical protein
LNGADKQANVSLEVPPTAFKSIRGIMLIALVLIALVKQTVILRRALNGIHSSQTHSLLHNSDRYRFY